MPFPEAADHDAPPSDLDRLRVALAVQLARDIANADGVLDIAELHLLGQAFPDDWMRRCGFLDGRGQLNAEFERTLARAHQELHRRLDIGQKLDMLTFLHETCMADGELHDRELELLTEAARRLHVPRDAFRKLVSEYTDLTITAVPPVRRDE